MRGRIMKKIVISLAAMLVALSFVSCNKEEESPAQTEKQEIQFDFTVGDLIPETRAAKTDWVDGDKINIWFDGNSEKTPDLVITYDGSKWKAGELREGCELTEGTGKTLAALYESQNDLSKYSLSGSTTSGELGVQVTYKTITAKAGNLPEGLSPASMMAACSATYSYSDGKVTSNLDNWGFNDDKFTQRAGIINGFQVTIEGIPDGEYAMHCVANSADNNYLATQHTLYVGNRRAQSSSQYYVSSQASDGTAVFYFSRSMQQPDKDLDNIPVTFTLIPKMGDTYSLGYTLIYTATIKVLKKIGSYQPVKIKYEKFHEAVDMGTGIKWATMNVGASSPEDHGDFFAWGETETYYDSFGNYPAFKADKSGGYIESSYFDLNNDEFLKYHNANEGKTVLEPEDDVATKNWGGSWRIPTADDWNALLSNSTSEWTTLNGKYGRKITSKINGNSIFLPAAGHFQGIVWDMNNEWGSYWSSSLSNLGFSGSDTAKFLSFDSGKKSVSGHFRWFGLSVRPVSN